MSLWIVCVFASTVKSAAMCVQASPIPATMPIVQTLGVPLKQGKQMNTVSISSCMLSWSLTQPLAKEL